MIFILPIAGIFNDTGRYGRIKIYNYYHIKYCNNKNNFFVC